MRFLERLPALLLGLVIFAANLGYWHLVVRRGDERFCRYVERTLGVRITRTTRWHWSVSSDRSWLYNLGVELLQLAYYMVAFAVWGLCMLACVAFMSLFAD